MKSVLWLFSIFSFFLTPAQEIEKVEKIKLGSFKYEISLKEDWNYEKNINIISYNIRFKDKEQWLGTLLTYRKIGSSKNYEKKDSEELPQDIRASYKDGIILSEGEINIDEKMREIIITEKTFYKDVSFENTPDCTRRIYKQNKNGFFDLMKISEYKNGEERDVFEK